MAHRLLCVHPHPDDESIACGGLIAGSVRAGHDVHVVTCTYGEEGENQSGIDLGGRQMGDVRRDEMADAIIALGSPTHHWLGYRDSGMVDDPANNHPDAFHAAELDEASLRLAAIIRSVRPHVIVSDDEHGTYGHPDHIKANRVTIRAVELAADPAADVVGEAWETPKRYVHAITKDRLFDVHQSFLAAGLASPFGEEPLSSPDDMPFGSAGADVTGSIPLGELLAVKRAAMAAHRSQIGEDSFFLNTPPELDDDMFGTEEFVLERGVSAPDDDGLEHDLFAGIEVET